MNKRFQDSNDEQFIESGRIFIRGEIDEESEEHLSRYLRQASSEGLSSVYIYISSEGGDVDSACAMIDEINGAKKRGMEIITIALGRAYSAAAYLLTFGDKKYATENTTIMLHPILFELDMDYISNQKAYTSFTEKKYDEIITKVAKNCGKTTKASIIKFRKDIEHGLWLHPSSAKKMKVVDEIWDYSKEPDIDEEGKRRRSQKGSEQSRQHQCDE